MSIQPPEEAPKGMGAIIQHIYDQLNRLAEGGEGPATASPLAETGGGVASVGSGAVYSVSSHYPHLMTATVSPFVRPMRHAFTVADLLVRAESPPTQAGGFDFDVVVGATVVDGSPTFTLDTATAIIPIDTPIAKNEVLKVRAAETQNAENLADVSFVFRLIR